MFLVIGNSSLMQNLRRSSLIRCCRASSTRAGFGGGEFSFVSCAAFPDSGDSWTADCCSGAVSCPLLIVVYVWLNRQTSGVSSAESAARCSGPRSGLQGVVERSEERETRCCNQRWLERPVTFISAVPSLPWLRLHNRICTHPPTCCNQTRICRVAH